MGGQINSLFSAMSLPAAVGEQPRFDWYFPSIWNSLFYVAFMFLGSIFILQLFIGVSFRVEACASQPLFNL
jgi:hypothetical protein